MLTFIIRRLRSFKEHRPLTWMIRTVLFIFLFGVLHTMGFMWTESASLNESLWQTWQTFTTVGYGNAPAATPSGRLVTVLFGSLGIAAFGAFIGAYFDYREYSKEQRIFGMTANKKKDGYVLLNAPSDSKLRSFISEIRHIEKDIPICIVSDSIEELPRSIATIKGVTFIHGNLLSKDTYERAGLLQSKAAIVFPATDSSGSDAITKVIVDLVYKFVGNTYKVRVMHVLVDPNNSWLFEGCESHQILQDMDILSVVQEAQDMYSAAIFEQLFRNTTGENPVTVDATEFEGVTWNAFVSATLVVYSKTGMQSNPLSLIRRGVVDTCPKGDFVMSEADYISLIVEDHFDWGTYEAALLKEINVA